MSEQEKLSIVTKNYICRFNEILNEMIDGMTKAELNASISHNFIVQMIPHHKAAIEMSNNLLQYTTCIPLQNIALNIIAEQTKSIEDMQCILKQCSQLQNPQQALRMYYKNFYCISQTMFAEMKNACTTNDINTNFMNEMIPHHKGAVRMSENALRYNICPELRPILKAIITSQEKGICEMEKLLRCS